jgi:hypothetical protein
VRYEACRALADLKVAEAAPILLELAETETGRTKWGASVAEVARMAASEVANNARDSMDEEFERISRLIQQHAPTAPPQA